MIRPIFPISDFCDTVFCFPVSVLEFVGASSGFKTKMQELMAYTLIGKGMKLSSADS
jgi:hypothetical protein